MGYGVEHADLESALKKSFDSDGLADGELTIIKRVQAGSKDDFRELVLAHKDMIFSLILRQVGAHHVAEELTQEVFVKAFLNIKRFRQEAKFSTWLTRIALNHTNSYFTSKKFRQQRLTESFDHTVHDMSDTERSKEGEKERENEELLASFRSALSYLKPKFRDVLVLCGLEGRSYQDAADILAIPIGTVRSRLNKARLLIKERLDTAI